MNLIEKLSRIPKRITLPYIGECYIVPPSLRMFLLVRDAENNAGIIVRILAECIVDQNGKPCLDPNESEHILEQLDGLKVITVFQALMNEFTISPDEVKKTVNG